MLAAVVGTGVEGGAPGVAVSRRKPARSASTARRPPGRSCTTSSTTSTSTSIDAIAQAIQGTSVASSPGLPPARPSGNQCRFQVPTRDVARCTTPATFVRAQGEARSQAAGRPRARTTKGPEHALAGGSGPLPAGRARRPTPGSVRRSSHRSRARRGPRASGRRRPCRRRGRGASSGSRPCTASQRAQGCKGTPRGLRARTTRSSPWDPPPCRPPPGGIGARGEGQGDEAAKKSEDAEGNGHASLLPGHGEGEWWKASRAATSPGEIGTACPRHRWSSDRFTVL